MKMPWHAPFDPQLLHQAVTLDHQSLLASFNHLSEKRQLATGMGQPLQFVPQSALPAGVPYEQFIANTGCVPTRNNAHDRYNALVWLSAPKTKAVLNRAHFHGHAEFQAPVRVPAQTQIQTQKQSQDRSQAADLAAQAPSKPSSSNRGLARDTLTLWDENLALIVLPCSQQGQELTQQLTQQLTQELSQQLTQQLTQELTQHMAQHDWHWLFIDQHAAWGTQWQVVVFGHALLEKLDQPFKAITAHSLVIQAKSAAWPDIDQALSGALQLWVNQKLLSPKIFKPLPLMGIPGWHPENNQPSFYTDTKVFRPARDLRQAPLSGDA